LHCAGWRQALRALGGQRARQHPGGAGVRRHAAQHQLAGAGLVDAARRAGHISQRAVVGHGGAGRDVQHGTAGAQGDAAAGGQGGAASHLQAAAVQQQVAGGGAGGCIAKLGITIDGQAAGPHPGGTRKGVGPAQGQLAITGLGQRALRRVGRQARQHAGKGQLLAARHGHGATAGTQLQSARSRQREAGIGLQGAAIQQQVAGRGHAGHGTQLAVGAECQGAGQHLGGPGVGAGRRTLQAQQAGACLGQGAAAGTGRVGQRAARPTTRPSATCSVAPPAPRARPRWAASTVSPSICRVAPSISRWPGVATPGTAPSWPSRCSARLPPRSSVAPV
jgi:hypothetical protein